MKENIVIPLRIEQVRRWTRRTLEAATWLICLGLLVAGAAIASVATLVWLISGSEAVMVIGFGGGLLLGLAGVRHLLRQINRAAIRLRHEPPPSNR